MSAAEVATSSRSRSSSVAGRRRGRRRSPTSCTELRGRSTGPPALELPSAAPDVGDASRRRSGRVGYLLRSALPDPRRSSRPSTSRRRRNCSRPGGRPAARGARLARELTPRERDVLALMAEGRSNAAVAAELVVTESAVEKHAGDLRQARPLAVDSTTAACSPCSRTCALGWATVGRGAPGELDPGGAAEDARRLGRVLPRCGHTLRYFLEDETDCRPPARSAGASFATAARAATRRSPRRSRSSARSAARPCASPSSSGRRSAAPDADQRFCRRAVGRSFARRTDAFLPALRRRARGGNIVSPAHYVIWEKRISVTISSSATSRL